MGILTICKAVFYPRQHTSASRLWNREGLCSDLKLGAFLCCFRGSFRTCKVDCHLCCKPNIKNSIWGVPSIYIRHHPHQFWTWLLWTPCRSIRNSNIFRHPTSPCSLDYEWGTLNDNWEIKFLEFLDEIWYWQLAGMHPRNIFGGSEELNSSIGFV